MFNPMGGRARERNYLFAEYDLREVLEKRKAELDDELNRIPGDEFLNTSPDDLCKYAVDKYTTEAPQLYEDGIHADQRETQKDVSRDPDRMLWDRSGPYYVPAVQIYFFIPFEGDDLLFRCVASTRSSSLPQAVIQGKELIVSFLQTDPNPEKIKQDFQQVLGNIRQHLSWVTNDVKGYNASLKAFASQIISSRRERLLRDRSLVAGLGYPVRQREGQAGTFVAPQVRRKVIPTRPIAQKGPYSPEPVLSGGDYDHILNVIQNMSLVMERSPSAFVKIDEESLRQHILVQLNSQFEGQATGETFNYEGKTDILIRVDGKNIFIGECKFWRGPEVLMETIAQVLGYTSWRDTKVALLIFNRNKNFSKVLEQIPALVEKHENFKRRLPDKNETATQYVLHHRDDPNRELTLTVMAFDVPTQA